MLLSGYGEADIGYRHLPLFHLLLIQMKLVAALVILMLNSFLGF